MVIASDVFNINISSEVKEYDVDYVPYDQRPETYIVPVVFSLILVVGVAGNGILVLILLCHANMRNVPNTYVLSLALGDLLVSIFLLRVFLAYRYSFYQINLLKRIYLSLSNKEKNKITFPLERCMNKRTIKIFLFIRLNFYKKYIWALYN